MTEGTQLVMFRDELRMALVVQIRNDYEYVEGYWTDEMERNTFRNDLREAKRMFLLGLCQLWYERTDEELIPVDHGEGTYMTLEEVKHG